MKHAIAALILTIASITLANTEQEHALTRIATNFANATDHVMFDCNLDTFAICLLGSGNKDLDKRRIDRILPDLTLGWITPWFASDTTSFGRGFRTTAGNMIIVTFEINSHQTWIIFFTAE